MITPAQVQQAIRAWDDMIEATGSLATFTLRNGLSFSIKAVRRKKPDENVTDGLQQKGFEIQFMYNRWLAGAGVGRDPEKGDQVEIDGRRYAIERSKKQIFGTASVGYVVGVLG